MMRGANFFLLGASVAVAGCATSQEVEVRAIADPAAKYRYGGGLLAVGRAQLALGNAGIALETFRKLQREQPGADAFAGIAACYASMGRFDIARANYEYALAYAPNDRGLLTALANSLDRLGEAAQAAEVRAEVAALFAPPTALARGDAPQPITPMAVPRVSSVTVKLPAAAPSAPRVSASVEIANAIFTRDSVGIAGAFPIDVDPAGLNANAGLPMLREEVVPAPLAPDPIPQPPAIEIAKAVFTRDSVETANARPMPVKQAALNVGVELAMPPEEDRPAPPPPPARRPQSMPAERPREVESARAEVRPFEGPYLTRSSLGIVSLITTAGPRWVAPAAVQETARRAEARATPPRSDLKLSQARMAAIEGPRWVPLKYSTPRPNIQILNAARVQSLAARNRTVLLDRGWRKIAIGNARQVRQRSLVLYAPAREAIAKRLAAHFHCKAVRAQAVQSVVVLLGRDAMSSKRATSRA